MAGSSTKTELKPFNVTVRVFDPAMGIDSGGDFVLPVDGPGAEDAATANSVSFTMNIKQGKLLPVAFTCIKVEPR